MSAASRALKALWLIMVELAEAANDEIVLQQRGASLAAADNIARRTEDLAQVAKAAAILARIASAP